MSALTEDEFRRMLDAKGLKLNEKSFAAALEGGRHLRDEVARLQAYLKSVANAPKPDEAP